MKNVINFLAGCVLLAGFLIVAVGGYCTYKEYRYERGNKAMRDADLDALLESERSKTREECAKIADQHTRPAGAELEEHRAARTREAECIALAIRSLSQANKGGAR